MGRSGWFRGKLYSTTDVPFPSPSTGDSRSEAAAVAPAVREALAACAASRGGRPDGVLFALPDRWFKIGLASPKAPRGKIRLGEYARWKLQTDWNLEEERIYFDWQDIGGRRDAPTLLLVAAERDVVDAVMSAGEAVGSPVAMCVPRGIALWNRLARSVSRDGPAAVLARDGNSFTFFGLERGRLRYLRSRRCVDGSERQAEEEETLSHFRETVGGEGRNIPLTEWERGPAVLDGLLSHPWITGVFA